MDAADWGWVAFAAFLVPWLGYDAWLYLTGQRTYSQAAYQWDRANGRKPSLVAAMFFAWLWWHFFG